MAGDTPLAFMRNGQFSAHAQQQLEAYLPALADNDQIVEIWTLAAEKNTSPFSCRLSLTQLEPYGDVIVFERFPELVCEIGTNHFTEGLIYQTV